MLRILVVSADRDLRRAWQRELSSDAAGDREALEAADAGAALEVMRTQPGIAAVVSDDDLGGGARGLELLAEIARRHPQCARVLACGSRAQDGNRPADVLVVDKPWPLGGLSAAVEEAMAVFAPGGTLEAVRRTLSYGSVPTVRLKPLGFQVGDLLADTYRLTGTLGQGGLGQVFEAYDQPVQRVVAIKVPLPDVDPASLRAEAQAIAAIRHPCVPAIYMLGKHRGMEFLAMERIRGATLQAHLEQRARYGQRFTIGETIDVVGALAEGLRAVHAAGISHRDVSSSNVIVAPGNRIVLLDLGIFSAEASAQSELVAGTPIYMAPEVATLRVRRGAGHLVDAYSLGVIAWELLTGAPPFEGSILEVLEKHMHAPLPDLTPLRPDAPAPLIELVRDLLSKNPAERPPTMDHVAAALRAMRAEPRPRRDSPTRTVNRAGHRLHALVVDDSAMARRMISEVLERTLPGVDVKAAASAEQGLQMVRDTVPDLLVVDLHLPGMSGFELCMFLRGTHLADRCTVIAVSGAAEDEDVRVLRQVGIRFAGKTAGLADLQVQIEGVFGRKS